MHIPLPEYITLYNEYPYFGQKGRQVSVWAVNTGLFAAVLENQPVSWISVGHNHGNDYFG